MRLYVGVFRSEELLGALDGNAFDAIHVLAAAVIALAGVSFGVFVGEDGAHRFEHRFGDEILGSDQLEPGGLPPNLVIQCFGDFGIDCSERPAHAFQFGGFVVHGGIQ